MRTESDLAAFLEHFEAVTLQYATLIRTKYATAAPAPDAGDPEPAAEAE